MPAGKSAGERCIQLTPDNRCRLFGRPDRPRVCVELLPRRDMCGHSASEALSILAALEASTRP
jgi:uncharacterized protein